MPNEPTPKKPVIPFHERRHTRVPKIDPKKWEEQPVFRETFMMYVSDPEHSAAYRVFSRTQFHQALAAGVRWDGTYAEAAAENLRAVLGDLRHLQGFLTNCFESEVDTLKHGLMTPRKERLYRLSGAFAEKVAALADEIEQEVQDSLQDDDEEDEDDWP